MQGAANKRIILIFLFFASLNFHGYTETTVLFSPDDKPTNHLIEKIRNAKTRIHAAVYMLTD